MIPATGKTQQIWEKEEELNSNCIHNSVTLCFITWGG